MLNADGTILVCENNGSKLLLSEFVKKYSDAYCIGKDKIPGICYKQTDDLIERNILEKDNSDYRDFVRKIAWKIGRIKCFRNIDGKIEYTNDWKDCETRNPMLFGKELDLKRYYSDLDISTLAEICKKDENEALNRILDKRISGIGIVYSIAVLFFVSMGKYPIYDRFAYTALQSIFSKEETFLRKGDSKKYENQNILSIYKNEYSNYIRILLEKLGKSNVNFIEYRELDRALWVYGHGF